MVPGTCWWKTDFGKHDEVDRETGRTCVDCVMFTWSGRQDSNLPLLPGWQALFLLSYTHSAGRDVSRWIPYRLTT